MVFPAIALPHSPADRLGLVAAVLGIVLGILVWVRRIRAEIRAAEGLPFLVPRRQAATIVGAEPDPPPGRQPFTGVQRPGRAEPSPRGQAPGAPARPAAAISLTPRAAARGTPARPAPGAPPRPAVATSAAPRPAAPGTPARPAATASPTRALGASAPTPATPAVPLAGGVHAILVSAVAGAQPARAPGPKLVPQEPTADDVTLQILPGRFEVEAPAGRPGMCFVRQPGPVTEITLGRRLDSDIGHVTLDAPTVSRLHARLRFADGRWTIANLSRTNPVRLNGRVLLESAGPQLLGEGDRVEVGEFLLVFRER